MIIERDIERIGVTQRYADAVIHNGTVYLVEVPQSLTADITVQTRAVLAGLDRLLCQADSHNSRLLMATIYLRDMADYDAMNAVWDAWLPAGCAPARACLQAQLSQPGYRIEIVATAAANPR